MYCKITTITIEHSFAIIPLNFINSIKAVKSKELRSNPDIPTAKKMEYLLTVLSFTLKLILRFRIKLNEIPIITLNIFAIR